MRIPWVCYAVQLSVSNVCNVYSTREVSRVMSPFAENDKLTSENNEKKTLHQYNFIQATVSG